MNDEWTEMSASLTLGRVWSASAVLDEEQTLMLITGGRFGEGVNTINTEHIITINSKLPESNTLFMIQPIGHSIRNIGCVTQTPIYFYNLS